MSAEPQDTDQEIADIWTAYLTASPEEQARYLKSVEAIGAGMTAFAEHCKAAGVTFPKEQIPAIHKALMAALATTAQGVLEAVEGPPDAPPV